MLKNLRKEGVKYCPSDFVFIKGVIDNGLFNTLITLECDQAILLKVAVSIVKDLKASEKIPEKDCDEVYKYFEKRIALSSHHEITPTI